MTAAADLVWLCDNVVYGQRQSCNSLKDKSWYSTHFMVSTVKAIMEASLCG